MAVGRDLDNNLVLAIDQGIYSTRVAVYTPQGDCVLSHTVPCPPIRFPDGRVELSSEEVLGGLRDSLLYVAQALGPRCQRLVAAGFSSLAGAIVAWDTDTGDPLSPVICEEDVRARGLLDRPGLSTLSVNAETGLPLSPHYGASKILWCLEQIPGVARAAEQGTLMVGPLVAYLFSELLETEQCAVSPGHAQRTQLWSIQSGDWSDALMSAFHLDRSWLPSCLNHDSCYGHLPLGGARLPVTSVHCEGSAALFARGAPNSETCYVDIGDCALIQRITDDPAPPDGLARIPVWLPESTRSESLYAWEARRYDTSTIKEETLVFELAAHYRTLAERLGPAQRIMLRNDVLGVDRISQPLANLTSTAVHTTDVSDAGLKGIAYTAAGMPKVWPSGVFGPIFHPLSDEALETRYEEWLKNRSHSSSGSKLI